MKKEQNACFSLEIKTDRQSTATKLCRSDTNIRNMLQIESPGNKTDKSQLFSLQSTSKAFEKNKQNKHVSRFPLLGFSPSPATRSPAYWCLPLYKLRHASLFLTKTVNSASAARLRTVLASQTKQKILVSAHLPILTHRQEKSSLQTELFSWTYWHMRCSSRAALKHWHKLPDCAPRRYHNKSEQASQCTPLDLDPSKARRLSAH